MVVQPNAPQSRRYPGRERCFAGGVGRTLIHETNGMLPRERQNPCGPHNLYVTSFNTASVLRYNGRTGQFVEAFVDSNPNLQNPTRLMFVPAANSFALRR